MLELGEEDRNSYGSRAIISIYAMTWVRNARKYSCCHSLVNMHDSCQVGRKYGFYLQQRTHITIIEHYAVLDSRLNPVYGIIKLGRHLGACRSCPWTQFRIRTMWLPSLINCRGDHTIVMMYVCIFYWLTDYGNGISNAARAYMKA